jgi:hypothetical protein
VVLYRFYLWLGICRWKEEEEEREKSRGEGLVGCFSDVDCGDGMGWYGLGWDRI